MPKKKKGYVKKRYKPKKYRGKKLGFQELVRQAGKGLPEYEVEVKTASRKLANHLVSVAQNSKKASEVDLDVDWI